MENLFSNSKREDNARVLIVLLYTDRRKIFFFVDTFATHLYIMFQYNSHIIAMFLLFLYTYLYNPPSDINNNNHEKSNNKSKVN